MQALAQAVPHKVLAPGPDAQVLAQALTHKGYDKLFRTITWHKCHTHNYLHVASFESVDQNL
jgi:hypothetical protein